MKTIAFVAAVLSPALAWPHHGWSEYDGTKTLKVSGKIIEAGYEHPHGFVRIEAAPGKIWRVVLAPPSRMKYRGLSREALERSATATVEGYANRNDADEMRAERITVDGKTVELR
jgi:hypothetical protein